MKKNGDMRCLVIDIGNTSTSLALYKNGAISRFAHIKGGIVKDGASCLTAVQRVARGGVRGAILGSVVPAVNRQWRELLRDQLQSEPLVVSHRLTMDVTIDYPRPHKIGADRLANACGGVAKYGAPLIVADFGTALTFDVVSPERAYIGGIITPGLPLMTDYLYEKTALLPRVKAGGQVAGIGRSTREAIRSGAKIGYRGIVREITNELLKTLGRETRLVATGGFARWVLADSNIPYLIDPTLTLFGLGRLFELNREKK